MKKYILVILFFGFFFIFAKGGFAMEITSPNFKNNTSMAKKFTCQGDGISPALQISGTPSNAKSLVLIVDDPDAVSGTFDHWLVYNIPPQTTVIKEGMVPGSQCLNDSGRKEWCPPCPPSGTHRYFFKVFALDSELTLPPSARRVDIEAVMQGHVLDKAEIIGLYKKTY